MADPELIGDILSRMPFDPHAPRLRFLYHWNLWTDDDGRTYPLPKGWRTLVRAYAEAGALDEDFADAIATAMGNRDAISTYGKFWYTLGVSRNMLKRDGGLDVPRDHEFRASEDPAMPAVLIDPDKPERLQRDRAAQADRERQERLDRLDNYNEWKRRLGPYVRNVGTGAVHYVTCMSIGRALRLESIPELPTPDAITCYPCKRRAQEPPSDVALSPREQRLFDRRRGFLEIPPS